MYEGTNEHNTRTPVGGKGFRDVFSFKPKDKMPTILFQSSVTMTLSLSVWH